MTITTPLKLDTVVLTSPSATFQAVSENDLQFQIENISENPSGHPAPLFAAVKRAKPMMSFKTAEIDVVASNIPVWGVAPGVTLYRKLSSGVAPVSRSATSHQKEVLTACIAYWSNITLPAREFGTADITICSIYNGTNEPVIHTGSVALAGTLTAANYFGAGPLWVTDDAGSPVTTNELSIDSITISSGAQFRSDGDCSNIYDTYGEVTIDQTEITIVTKTPRCITTFPQAGTNLTAWRFFARKFKNGGGFVADATAQHIKFSGTAGLLVPMNVTAKGQELYTDTFKIIAISPDGVTAPITMTASQAIA